MGSLKIYIWETEAGKLGFITGAGKERERRRAGGERHERCVSLLAVTKNCSSNAAQTYGERQGMSSLGGCERTLGVGRT